MAEQYGGTADDTPTIQIPDDNDIADAESVDLAFRAIWNSIRLSLQVQANRPTHQLARLRSIDLTSVVLSTIPDYVQNIKAFVPYQYAFWHGDTLAMTVANLDTGGGSFEANTAYYCYILWDGVTSAFVPVVSKQIPDETLCFMKSNPGFTRYLGAFFTSSTKQIEPIHKSNAEYDYDFPRVILNPADSSPIDFSLAGRIPTYCRKVKLICELYNTDTAVDDGLFLSSPGGSETFYPIGRGASVSYAFEVDLPLIATSVRARISTSSGKGQAQIRLKGFYET